MLFLPNENQPHHFPLPVQINLSQWGKEIRCCGAEIGLNLRVERQMLLQRSELFPCLVVCHPDFSRDYFCFLISQQPSGEIVNVCIDYVRCRKLYRLETLAARLENRLRGNFFFPGPTRPEEYRYYSLAADAIFEGLHRCTEKSPENENQERL